MNHRSLPFLIDGSFLILPPHPLHAFHISTFCCTPSTSPLLYACTPILVACVLMGLYFSFLHFTLFRCMIQSRLVAGSTLSRNPSPITSDFVADPFRFYLPVPIQVFLANSNSSSFSNRFHFMASRFWELSSHLSF